MPSTVHRFRLIPLVILTLAAPTAVSQPAAQPPLVIYSTGLTPVEKPAAGPLQVVAGGAFADAAAALAKDPNALAKVLADLGYQAVNVAAIDLETNAAAVRDLGRNSAVPLVSANVYTADKRQRMFRPYVVVQALGRRVGVTGVTSTRSESREFAVADPAESLKDVLASLAKESDVIVLLGAMDRASAADLVAASPSIRLCILSGGGVVDPLPLKVGGAYLLQAPMAGAGFGRAAVTFDDGHGVQKVDSSLVPRLSDPPETLTVFRRAYPQFSGSIEVPAKAAETGTLADGVALDQTVFPRARTNNRAAHLRVDSVRVASTYGPVKSAGGARLIVLGTQWENLIPLTVIYQKKVPTEYQIPNLADHCYLLVNGRRVARIHPKADELAGHVPVKGFKLPEIGSRENGNLVYELLSPEPIKTLELRYYDYAHGHMSARLVGTAEAFAANGNVKPLSPPLKNEVVEAGVFTLDRAPELNNAKAPAGMTYVVADLRARSTFTVDADATAFDPKARPGTKTKVGHVADWKESRKYLQLVVDGEYGYLPEPQSELEEEPRFLPDVMTGGKVVFLAPADAKSLELRCDFPNAKASTGGAVFRPKGITLALEGKRATLPQRTAIASVDDDVYRIQIVSQAAAAEFAGRAAAEGKKFLVLDVTVFNNSGRSGEFFQTVQQLKYASETGEQLAMSPATFAGMRRPSELIWIPPSERRTFQAAFEIPAGETRPRLAFTGVSKAQVLNLKPLDATATAAAPVKTPAKAPVEVAANNKPLTTPPMAPAKSPAPVTTAAKKDPPAPVPVPAPAPQQDIKPLRVAAKQPHEPKGLAGVGLTAEQVNSAIDRGAVGLWAHQKRKMAEGRHTLGDKLGYDALVALALVHADYHKKSPEFDAALRAMMSRLDPQSLGTYGAGVFAMLIEAYGDGYYHPKLKETVRCILENQRPDGTWDYTVHLDPKLMRDPAADRVLQIRGGIPLEGPGSLGEEMNRLKEFDPKNIQSGDNSTSQYAMLGLWSASKSKVPVVPETWQRALKSYRDRQCDDGGWAYHGKSNSGYGSMTCAGVCSITLARFQLGEKAPAEDPQVERGLAWLANNFSVTEHPKGSNAYFYYYLYSLERVGRILDTEFIGPHEWYPLGARFLIDKQKADGTWVGVGEEEYEHLAGSFALLFLTRATSSLNVAEKRGGDGKLRTDVAVAPGHRVYIILDCSGSMLPEIDGKQKFEIARDAVTALVASLPDNAEVALRAYGHRKNARQEGADEDTELLLPMGKLDRKAFATKLASLKARGKTPLALSMKQAAGDLSGIARDADKPVTVVLLTDGGEDTRGRQDPVASAAALAKLPGLNLQVVGFDINREDWTRQLQGIADSGGGQYLSAAKADTLLRELKSAVFRVPDTFIVTTPKGQPLLRAAFGTEKALPEGQYLFTTAFGGQKYSQPFWINTGATTAVVFDAAKIGADKSGEAVADTGAAAPAPADAPAPAVKPGAKKFCTSCGAPLAANAKFCSKCGAKTGG